MTTIHSDILRFGVQAVKDRLRQQADLDGMRIDEVKTELACIDIAAALLAEESGEIGFTHSGFCLTSLPHRDTKEAYWRRPGHRVTLMIESGREQNGELIGLPFGPKARLILLYLQGQAIRRSSPEIELGRSMAQWMGKMGLGDGGATRKEVRRQAHRISTCRLTFFFDANEGEARHNGAFVDSEFSLRDIGQQGDLFPEVVRLNPTFFQMLKDHPVPVWEPALRQIAGKSMAIDIYVWLAYRLRSLSKPTPISWAAIHQQFSPSVSAMRHFKPEFATSLRYALAAYPDARVEVEPKGLVLHPSRSPVPSTTIALPGTSGR